MTKERINWKNVVRFWFCVFILIGLLVTYVTMGPGRANRDCVRAGYLGYEPIAGKYVCVGIRDGVKVYEPLDDVRARWEGE